MTASQKWDGTRSSHTTTTKKWFSKLYTTTPSITPTNPHNYLPFFLSPQFIHTITIFESLDPNIPDCPQTDEVTTTILSIHLSLSPQRNPWFRHQFRPHILFSFHWSSIGPTGSQYWPQFGHLPSLLSEFNPKVTPKKNHLLWTPWNFAHQPRQTTPLPPDLDTA